MNLNNVTDPNPVAVNASGATNVGLRRELNEDAFLAEYPVFIVADGMGGHEAGEVASVAVIDLFRPLLGRDDLGAPEILSLLSGAHDAIAKATGSVNAGSTLTGVIAVHEQGVRRWMLINIGDSRVYRLHESVLTQLTRDHSLAQQLIDSGDLLPEDFDSFLAKNVITRAVGDQESAVDHELLAIVTGERLLVCSDGLSGEVSDTEIHRVLAEAGDTGTTAVALIDEALAAGGRDNITAIVLDTLEGTDSRAAANAERLSADDEVYDGTLEIITHRSERRRSDG